MKKLSFYYFTIFINIIVILFLFGMSLVVPTISYEGNDGLLGFLQAHNLTLIFIGSIVLTIYLIIKLIIVIKTSEN